ncbi:MAG: hypothetical protein HZA08_00495 [Nitrospirae bacterium]|nr:hypothetical protein [Nitrospirota bacterium]
MITIAWDVDDVLNDLMRMWFQEKWVMGHKDCRLSYKEITKNPPHNLLGADINEYLRSLDEYRLSDFYQQMPPVKEIMEWFVEYGDKCRHIALTAVPLIAASASAQWVFKNFGMWIRTFHFVPSNRAGESLPSYDSDKSDFLKWQSKVDVFIDDNPDNIKAAKSIGINGILWPRPWNDSKLTPAEALLILNNSINEANE